MNEIKFDESLFEDKPFTGDQTQQYDESLFEDGGVPPSPVESNVADSQFQYDKQYNAEINALDINTEHKKKSVAELDMSEDEKKVLNANIDAKYEKEKQALIGNAKDRYVTENKQAPTPTKSKDTSFNLYNELKDFENSILEPFNPAIELALNKVKAVSVALGETGEKALNFFGGFDSDFYDKKAGEIRSEGERLNKAIDPEGKLALSPTKMTDLYASMVLPLKVTTPKKMVALEGLLGYTTAMSETSDFSQSIKGGITQAGAAITGQVLVEKVIEKISKKGTGSALDYLWDKHEDLLRQSTDLPENATKQEVIDFIEKDWLSIMSGESSTTNKVRAMIDRLGVQGSQYKQAVQKGADIPFEKVVRQPKVERISELKGQTTGGSIQEAGKELGKQVGVSEEAASKTVDDYLANKYVTDTVKERFHSLIGKKLKKGLISETYGNFVGAMKNKYKGVYNVDETSFEAVKSALQERARLSKGLSGAELNLAESLSQPMTMDNILNIKRDINALINSSSGAAETNAIALRKSLKNIIENTFDEKDVTLLKQLDIEWSNRSKIVGKKDLNQIGAKLMNMVNGNKTVESVVEDLAKLDEGEVGFKQLEKVIGTKNIAKLEKGIVRSMLNDNVDDISYSAISNSLKKIGFITPEGKSLKKMIDKFDTIFSADNFTNLNRVVFQGEQDVVALTADLAQKVKYSVSSSIFKRLKKAFLTTKEADELRHLEDLTNILTEKKVYTKYGISKKIPEDKMVEVVRESMFQSYKDAIKTINAEADVKDSQIMEAVDTGMKDLGLGQYYGGKATKGNTSAQSSYDNYAQSLFGTKKEQEEFVKEVNRLGVKGTDTPTKANPNLKQGAREWFESLTNKQKEEVAVIVEKERDRTGGYGLNELYKANLEKASKVKKGIPSYTEISDSLFGTKVEIKPSTAGNLGMTSKYGQKATTQGGVNTKEAKAYLNRFMDDIANPKVEVNTARIEELYGMLKAEGTTMYGATIAKEKAWNKAMDIVNEVRKNKSVSPKVREQMIKAVKEYYDKLNDTI